ncbi:MAG TPA: CBS domain-containing protein [Burkholderiaceae bacterium]|nr:CBS domain-containing protein [Burkholderiaceae bacterium]
MTQVSEMMTRGVRTMMPADTLQAAAQAMEELNVGSVPVCRDGRLVGIVTDRDIVLRGVAQGCPADSTTVDQVMSKDVQWCFDDESLDDVTRKMCDSQIRRLPVLDRSNQLVGIVSLGDVAVKGDHGNASEALTDISMPAGPDRSGLSAASGAAGGGADAARAETRS